MSLDNILTEKEIKQIASYLNRETNVSLAEGLYEIYKGKFAEGGVRIPEDRRIADFVFLLPQNTKNSNALLIGAGKGLFPLWITDYFKEITVVDMRPDVVEFLNITTRAQNKNNLSALNISNPNDITSVITNHASENYDCIIITTHSFQQMLNLDTLLGNELSKFTTTHSCLVIFAENPFSWKRMMKMRLFSHHHTKARYIRLLKNIGYRNITLYAPLPLYDTNPLFYLPIPNDDNNKIAKYFFKNIFGLFDMVSPEVKNKHTLELFIARFLTKMALHLNLTNFLTNFVSGYILIAEK